MNIRDGAKMYYVNPCIFNIEIVQIECTITDDTGVYCIDKVGAYLSEQDLHDSLQEAKLDAISKLISFYKLKLHQIKNQIPVEDSYD